MMRWRIFVCDFDVFYARNMLCKEMRRKYKENGGIKPGNIVENSSEIHSQSRGVEFARFLGNLLWNLAEFSFENWINIYLVKNFVSFVILNSPAYSTRKSIIEAGKIRST